MRIRPRCIRHGLLGLLSVVVLLAGSVTACTRSYGTDSPPALPGASGRALDNPILAPPSSLFPATTSPALPQPALIPGDPYTPEPVQEIGTIEIPAIGLNHPMFRGVTLHNIDRGPSHWTGTAEPGSPGNTVFAGHRVTNSRPFRHIDDLVPGDEVIFTVEDDRFVYEVTGSRVVPPSATWIADQSTATTGTLYACHPPGSLAYRYVVELAMVN